MYNVASKCQKGNITRNEAGPYQLCVESLYKFSFQGEARYIEVKNL